MFMWYKLLLAWIHTLVAQDKYSKEGQQTPECVLITVATVTGPWQTQIFFWGGGVQSGRIYAFVIGHLDTTAEDCLRLFCFLPHHFTMILLPFSYFNLLVNETPLKSTKEFTQNILCLYVSNSYILFCKEWTWKLFEIYANSICKALFTSSHEFSFAAHITYICKCSNYLHK